MIEALGAPVVLLDEQGVAQAQSPAMQALIPGIESGKALALVLRDPDLNDAIAQELDIEDYETMNREELMTEIRDRS